MEHINHIIVTYGGGEVLNLVFNAVAAIFKDKEFYNTMKISAFHFGFWVLINSIVQNSHMIVLRWFVWFVVCTNIILLPKTTIKINDPLTKHESTVSNVPYILGSFASTISQVGDVLTKRMETNFSLPDDLQYHKSGSVFASKLLGQMNRYRVRDAILKANLHRFIQNCVVYDATNGFKYDMNDLQSSNDLISLVSETSSINGFTYQFRQTKDGSGYSKIISCKEGISLIKNELAGEVNFISKILGNANGKKTQEAISSEFKSQLANSFTYMSALSKHADKELTNEIITNNGSALLKQGMMINAIQDATKNKTEELGNPHTYASTKALLQQRSTYNAVAELASQTLVVTRILFEVLAYSSFIFVAFLMLMPNGFQVLTQYLGLLMWIQLWPPLYAVLNLVINVAAQHKSVDALGTQGLSMLTSVGLANIHSDMQALAGYLSMSIPFISYALVKGGAASFMHLAGSLNSGFQSAASSAAAEITSGNLSMGNISYANSSLNNMSGFKHDTNLSYQDGRMEASNQDGSTSFYNASGSSGFKAGAGLTSSTWEQQINMQGHLSAVNSKALQQETANMSNLGFEYSNAESHAFKDSRNLLERLSKNGSQNRTWSVGDSAEHNKAFNETTNFSNELQERFGYSQAQAADITSAVGLGMGALGSFANIQHSFKNNADFQDAINKGKSFAESKGYTSSIQDSIRYMDQIAFSENEQYEMGLAKDLASSYDKMNSTRESLSVSEQNVERLSEAQSFIDTQGAMLNKNVDQLLVDYVASQPNPYASHGSQITEMGSAMARKILLQNDEMTNSYVQQFLRKEGNKMLGDLPTAQNTGLGNSSFNKVPNLQMSNLKMGDYEVNNNDISDFKKRVNENLNLQNAHDINSKEYTENYGNSHDIKLNGQYENNINKLSTFDGINLKETVNKLSEDNDTKIQHEKSNISLDKVELKDRYNYREEEWNKPTLKGKFDIKPIREDNNDN